MAQKSAEPTNATRSERAYRTLLYYSQHANGDGPRNSIADLLTDLRHWCDEDGTDFAHELNVATENYLAEA